MNRLLRFALAMALAVFAACEGDTTTVTPTEPGNPPVAGFTANVNGKTVTVTDTSVNAQTTSYAWGDGLSDPIQSGSHTYVTASTYTIVQTVANQFGDSTTSRTVEVGDIDPAPVAAFEVVSITASPAGWTVSFRDRSTNAVTHLWDFGDGELDTLRSPNHTYRNPGLYTVILAVYNGSGDESRTDQTVTLESPPAASFTAAIQFLVVTVTDQSTGADTVFYDWDDGTSDSFRSGSHAFLAAGTYAIQQRVQNDAGDDVQTRTVTVAAAKVVLP